MATLRTHWKNNPGLVVSAGAHASLLVFLLVNFAFPPHFEEPSETIAVEMVSASEMNQVMNGEEKQKQLPTPQRRVDKVAALEERNPTPPVAEAKKDTPPPPAPEKANDDPGRDDKKTEAVAAQPPAPPPPPVPPPVVPTPPERPVEKAEAPPKDVPSPPERPVEKAEAPKAAPEPMPRPEPVKPPPENAEALAPKPPPRPKAERKDAKKEIKPVAKPVKVAKVVPPAPPPPPPPQRPEPKPEPKATPLDMVARLLDKLKPTRAEEKQRSGDEAKEKSRDDFNPSKISALLDREAPQHKGSTGKQLTQLASLGSPTAHSDKMSPSLAASVDGWLIDHYNGCWHYFGLGASQSYVPKVRVRLGPDGTLIAKPALINPPSDANLRSLADSAIRAVNECNPLPIPDWLKPHYEAWRDRTINFDLKDRT